MANYKHPTLKPRRGVRLVDAYGRHMQHHDLYAALEAVGLFAKGKLVPQGGVTVLQGVAVTVRPANPSRAGLPDCRSNAKHRVYCRCTCGKDVPAGRLHQHRCD